MAVAKIADPDAPLFWIALTLCGPVLLAAGNLYRTLRWPPGAAAESLAPGMLAAGGAWLVLAAPAPGIDVAVDVGSIDLAFMLGLQAAIFAAQFILLFVCQAHGGPVLLSLLGAVAAVFSLPIAVFLLGEAPPPGLALGGGLIVLGVALVAFGRSSKPR